MAKRVPLKSIAAAVLLSCLASTASAGTVTATFLDVPQYRDFNVSTNGGQNYSSVRAGELDWHRVGGTQPGSPSSQFSTFCIELNEHVNYSGTYTFNVVNLAQAPDSIGSPSAPGMQSPKANLIRELWGRHYNDVLNPDTSAAFQLAIWEIVNDNGLKLNDGSFRVSPQSHPPLYVTTAQNWLTSLDGTGPKAHLMGLSTPGVQDQVFAVVPLPAAVYSGLALLLPLAILKTRRTRLAKQQS